MLHDFLVVNDVNKLVLRKKFAMIFKKSLGHLSKIKNISFKLFTSEAKTSLAPIFLNDSIVLVKSTN